MALYRKIIKTGTSEQRGFFIFTYEDNDKDRRLWLFIELEKWAKKQPKDVQSFFNAVKQSYGYDEEKRIRKIKKYMFPKFEAGIEW